MAVVENPLATRPSPLSPVDDLRAPNDILVFERSDMGFVLTGERGRGASWAGVVTVSETDETIVRRAWQIGTPVRVAGRRSQQVVGPYYARAAIAIPVGDRHVVVIGSNRRIEMGEPELVRLAAATVDMTRGVPADKLLADELELVQTLRALMAYRPETVRETLRHIATVAAGALSCEVAVIRVEHAGRAIAEAIGLGRSALDIIETTSGDALPWPTGRAESLVEQTAPPIWRQFGADLASSLSLPVGSTEISGVLALGHARTDPRGFTSLCQRIGRAIAEAAELLITQAAAREELAQERDLLARVSGTDPLTGLANRRAWDEAASTMASAGAPTSGFVISCDLDGLKAANDRYGHSAGDARIRGAANLLISCVRQSDLVARVGGDEFAVLLRGGSPRSATRVRARIRRAERHWRVTEHALVPRMSMGMAEITENDLESARHEADRRMYADKRARARRASSLASSRGGVTPGRT